MTAGSDDVDDGSHCGVQGHRLGQGGRPAGECAVREAGVDMGWPQIVDGHSAAPLFACDRGEPRAQRGFRGAVVSHARLGALGDEPRDRSCRASWPEQVQGSANDGHRGERVHCHQVFGRGLGQLLGRAEGRHADRGEDQVDAREVFGGPGRQPATRIEVVGVQGPSRTVFAVRRDLVQSLAVPPSQGERRTASAQRAGKRTTDFPSGADNQDTRPVLDWVERRRVRWGSAPRTSSPIHLAEMPRSGRSPPTPPPPRWSPTTKQRWPSRPHCRRPPRRSPRRRARAHRRLDRRVSHLRLLIHRGAPSADDWLGGTDILDSWSASRLQAQSSGE
ncbi:hypothetical protein SAMN05216499_109206 [Actinacidiphila paucisporea]|uniref:Uncharacterized protein n=1 Tax=Actinacidiphila paucisporea TaxID=310782 RepID=A0A1M7H9K5_9ACTN|nr:hypothetical protein SAMN05216499_109206 [Actinacidiphila paucisporea]